MEETPIDTTPSKRKIFIPMVIILTLVVGVLMAIKASVQREVKSNLQAVELAEGATLPDFEMTRLDGSKVTLGHLPHQVMMINFWASWCEACIEEMPSIVALREKYNARGFEVLGVNVDENPQQVVPSLLKKFSMNFPIFTDQSNTLSEIFDVHAIPLSVILDKGRKILFIESGGREWNDEEMRAMMEKWLSGK